MGDTKEKMKSFLKKINNPFSSSRKFKGSGHRLGTSLAPPSLPPEAAQPKLPSAGQGDDSQQQWMRQQQEQKSQQGDWRKLQQEKWEKERNIHAEIPAGHVKKTNPASSVAAANSSHRQGAATHPPDEKQTHFSSAAVFNDAPQTVSEKSDAEMDRLLGAVESREELATALGSFLSAQPSAAVLDVILRLLRNIVKDPNLEKFRRIRMGNPKIKETIGTSAGAMEVLEELGFGLVQEGEESWAVLDEPGEEGVTVLKAVIALMELQSADSSNPTTVPSFSESSVSIDSVASIDRQLRVFFPSSDNVALMIQLPDSFYELSVAEIKSEAAGRRKKLEDSQMMIPKSYREKQTAATKRKYKFSVIRVQFPDDMIIQGVFLPKETTAALYEFVESTLANNGLDFELTHPLASKSNIIPRRPLLNGKCSSMEEAGLVPTAVLKFKPIPTETICYCGLRPECTAISEPLTAVPF